MKMNLLVSPLSSSALRQVQPSRRWLAHSAALLGLLVLFAMSTLTGRAQGTQILRGQVTDEVNAAIPGATITVTGADGKARTATTNVTGEFSVGNLPAGVYRVTSEYTGFETFLVASVQLPLSQPLKIVMKIAAVSDVIETRLNDAALNVEPDQNLSATVLGQEFINTLPQNEDELRDVLNGLANSPSGNAQIIVDGFGNNQRLPPREAIMSIRINQNPYSPEFSGNGFSRVEIITKPGNDSWRGGGSWGFRNSGLDARNAFALVRPDYGVNRFELNFGGPIIKKKLSASLFANRSNTDGASTTVATTLTGPFVANVEGQRISSFYGTRADYLLNNNNTLNLSYNYNRTNSLNNEFVPQVGFGFGGGFGGRGGGGGGGGGGGFGGFGGGGANNLLPEYGSDSVSDGHNFRIGVTSIINPKLLHEARLQIDRDWRNATARTKGVAIIVLDSFTGGGSTCCPNTSTQRGIEYQDYLTYTSKGAKHTIKGGFQLQYDATNSLSASNFNGTYTFSNLAAYRLAQTNPTDPAARAVQFTLNRGTTVLDYGMARGSWFVNDDWRFSQNLTVSIGLRHEFQQHLQDKINFAPRLGIAWSPFKNRKTTIRGGGGLFYDRLNAGSYANALRFNGQTQESYVFQNAIFVNDTQRALDTNLAAGNAQNRAQAITTRPLDPQLNAPYEASFSLGVEQQLPKNLVGTFTYQFARGVHQFRSRNINAPTGFQPDPNFPNDPTRLLPIYPTGQPGIIQQFESTGFSKINRLTFGVSRRMGKVMTFGNYNLSWSRSDADGGLPANNYDLRAEWGRASGDIRHSFFNGLILTLPKSFRVSAFTTASSGAPFNILTGRDDNRDGSVVDRPTGLKRNADLLPSFYSLPEFNRTIISNQTCGSLQKGSSVTLVNYLQSCYPNGVKAQSPGSFTVNLNVSKTVGFFKRAATANAQQQQQGGPGGGGDRGSRGGGFGGPGGGGRGGGGPMMMGGGGPMMMGGGGPMMMGMGSNSEGYRLNVTFQVGVNNIFNRVNFGAYSGTLGTSYFGISNRAGGARQVDFNLRFNF